MKCPNCGFDLGPARKVTHLRNAIRALPACQTRGTSTKWKLTDVRSEVTCRMCIHQMQLGEI